MSHLLLPRPGSHAAFPVPSQEEPPELPNVDVLVVLGRGNYPTRYVITPTCVNDDHAAEQPAPKTISVITLEKGGPSNETLANGYAAATYLSQNRLTGGRTKLVIPSGAYPEKQKDEYFRNTESGSIASILEGPVAVFGISMVLDPDSTTTQKNAEYSSKKIQKWADAQKGTFDGRRIRVGVLSTGAHAERGAMIFSRMLDGNTYEVIAIPTNGGALAEKLRQEQADPEIQKYYDFAATPDRIVVRAKEKLQMVFERMAMAGIDMHTPEGTAVAEKRHDAIVHFAGKLMNIGDRITKGRVTRNMGGMYGDGTV